MAAQAQYKTPMFVRPAPEVRAFIAEVSDAFTEAEDCEAWEQELA